MASDMVDGWLYLAYDDNAIIQHPLHEELLHYKHVAVNHHLWRMRVARTKPMCVYGDKDVWLGGQDWTPKELLHRTRLDAISLEGEDVDLDIL
jgi:hypothetical protein